MMSQVHLDISSLINVLVNKKSCSTAPIPGQTSQSVYGFSSVFHQEDGCLSHDTTPGLHRPVDEVSGLANLPKRINRPHWKSLFVQAYDLVKSRLYLGGSTLYAKDGKDSKGPKIGQKKECPKSHRVCGCCNK